MEQVSYFCVICKYLGCVNAGKGDIALQEFDPDFHVPLPPAEFKVRHNECGLEFTYDPCDVYRKDLERIRDFQPHPNFLRVPIS
jgi:hypothetical protein